MQSFLGLPNCDAEEADIRLLPIPFEGTVSYGKGTSAGPAAILQASTQVELWDDELNFDLESLRYHTADEITPEPFDSPQTYLERLEQRANDLRAESASSPLARGGLTIGIGGEHSVTPALVRAAHHADNFNDLTVVQLDAHADLRDEYEGTPDSHACAMRRLVDGGAELIAIGIRSFSREEFEFAADHGSIKTYRAQSLANDPGSESALLAQLRGLNGAVYITVDMDGFDCSLCPATGTPEPGGLSWWQSLRYLRTVICESPNSVLIGCDVVETVPMQGSSVNEFTAARLIAKLAAYVGHEAARAREHSRCVLADLDHLRKDASAGPASSPPLHRPLDANH